MSGTSRKTTSRRFQQKATATSMRIYFHEISKIPLLTPSEEKELARRIRKGDKDALQKLTESNLRFVIKTARRFGRSRNDLPDLINVGNLGLMQAAKRFDPDMDVRFTSYAIWWIRQAIFHYLAESGQIIRISPRIANVLYRLAKTAGAPEEQLHDLGGIEGTATRIGVNKNDLAAALRIAGGVASLDEPIAEEGQILLRDKLEQTIEPSPEEVVIENTMRRKLNDSIACLSLLEQKVIRMRFGLEARERDLTLREVGHRLNFSRERIRQIENQALRKLRGMTSAKALATYLN